MNDMNAFERQLSAEVAALMGPVRPVDDAALFAATITATQSPKWRLQSMFSATKFVVAGAIVALFGGFLLAGVLTTQPSDESMPAVGAPAPTVEATGDSKPTAEDRVDEPTDLTALPGTFSRTGSLAEARGGHTATLLPDGRVLIIGGGREGSLPTEQRWEEVALVEAWDPATETFGRAGTLGEGRSAHTATLLSDGRVLVIGGDVLHDDGAPRPSEAVTWDPVTEMFSPAGSTAEGRAFHTATLLPDARVLVVGGYDGRATQHASAEVWDPATETFSSAGSLAERRGRHTATLLPDGRVLVVGGYGSPYDEDVGSAEIWDPATGTFAPAGTLERSRQGHVAALLPDGRVLIAGGQYIHTDPDGGGENRIVATAEIWDPATESFASAGALAGGGGDTATILSDGRVLIVGGCCDDEHQALASAEIWDPLVGSFVPAGSLADARIGHTATLLADGRVLVVGGEGSTDPYTYASAEIWTIDGKHGPISDDADDVGPPESMPETERAAEDQTDDTATTTPDLLPGVDLVTEEVEPGVFRVVSDGTENDMAFGESDPEPTQVVAGQDGSVWVFDQERLVRLGRPGSVNTSDLDEYWHDISVAPDGTVWALGRRGAFGSRSLFSLNDGEWQSHPLPDRTWASGIATPPDGSVWASLAVGSGDCRVARLVDGAWQQEAIEPASTNAGGESLAVGPDGTMLLGSACGGGGRLLERGEDGWAPPAVFDDSRAADFEFIGPIAIGLDGTAWVNMLGRGGTRLARRADGDWEIIGDDGSVPTLHGPQVWELSMTVSDDGRLWAAFDDPAVALADNRDYFNDSGNNYLAALGSGCPGAISFDGTTWSQHLAGACVTHVSAAPNGNVWATVVESPAFEEHSLDPARAPTGLYVITPEAVAATE